jgi:nitrogen fixation NifU-like protein
MDQLYQQLILDHSKAPHGKGLAQPFTGESFQVNPMCGDQVRLRVETVDDAAGGLRVEGVSWEGRGCSISQASVSVLTDLARGASAAEAARLGEMFLELMRSRGAGLADEEKEEALGDAIAFQGVSQYPARVKCALLGWMALREALAKAAAGDASPALAPEGFT